MQSFLCDKMVKMLAIQYKTYMGVLYIFMCTKGTSLIPTWNLSLAPHILILKMEKSNIT